MSIRGGRIENDRPGWRDDVRRPGIQRYWDGAGWDKSIPPRPKPEPAWKGARVIALGILIAVACIWLVWQASQPSDAECSLQRLKVSIGERLSVESACIGR